MTVAVGDDTAAAARERVRLFGSWTLVVAGGEAAGFLAPAVAGVVAPSLPGGAGVLLVLVAGAAEGAVLGLAQQVVLRRVLPGVRGLRWILLTAAAAVLAYVLGFLASHLAGSGSVLGFVGAGVLGLLLLATIGSAQYLELRHHVARAIAWVGWTALAWLAGLAAFLAIATPLWHPGQTQGVAIGVGVVAGAVMAVVQAAITGRALLRLLVASGSKDPGRDPEGHLAL